MSIFIRAYADGDIVFSGVGTDARTHPWHPFAQRREFRAVPRM